MNTTETPPGEFYCPTCGANDRNGHCATPTGRDHPARKTWARAFRAGIAYARAAATTRDMQQIGVQTPKRPVLQTPQQVSQAGR